MFVSSANRTKFNFCEEFGISLTNISEFFTLIDFLIPRVIQFLFLLVIDWVMRRSVEGARTGIRWKMTTMLEDLDFCKRLGSDYISSTFAQIQMRIDRLNRNGKGTGLKISTKKTKVMRINVHNNNAVVIDGQEEEDVNSFDYLGARITKHGGAKDDIKNRLGKATGAELLAKVWRSGELSKNTKIRIF